MSGTKLTPRITALLAIASAVTAANVYVSQPLLGLIAADLGVGESTSGLVPTLTQVGYALGILLIVPLGDSRSARKLIAFLACATAAALAAAAVAPSAGVLIAVSFVIGVATPIPQLIVPLALGLSSEEDQGRIIGRIQAGLLMGVLGSRLYSGALASAVDWRAVYVTSAVLTIGVAVLILRAIPEQPARPASTYGQLLGSMRTLVATRPLVRQICVSGAFVGVAFGSFWTVLVFMLEDAYGYDTAVIGAFGLVAAASAAFSPRAGRLADRRGGAYALRATVLMTIAGWLLLLEAEASILWVLAGVIVLDLGVWGNQVVNQFVLLRSDPGSRSRLNTLYFTARFAGIGLGSAVGSALWTTRGWDAVVALGVGAAVLGLLVAFRVQDPAPARAEAVDDRSASGAEPALAGSEVATPTSSGVATVLRPD